MKIIGYSALPEITPCRVATPPDGSAITLPHDLHVTEEDVCEYTIFSSSHSLHFTF